MTHKKEGLLIKANNQTIFGETRWGIKLKIKILLFGQKFQRVCTYLTSWPIGRGSKVCVNSTIAKKKA